MQGTVPHRTEPCTLSRVCSQELWPTALLLAEGGSSRVSPLPGQSRAHAVYSFGRTPPLRGRWAAERLLNREAASFSLIDCKLLQSF